MMAYVPLFQKQVNLAQTEGRGCLDSKPGKMYFGCKVEPVDNPCSKRRTAQVYRHACWAILRAVC
jgi:hypothetical protein